MKWGFGARDRVPVINAWAEGMLDSDLLARHVREKRCLIPVRGYYEWDTRSKPRQPYCLRMKDQPTFALAGIWREFVGQKQFVVVTVRPNPLIQRIHDRMPCLVAEEDFGLWLEGNCDEAIAKVCVPFPAEAMTMAAVTRDLEHLKPESEQGVLF
ncbi:MAG: SOS response-associated peptidase family protein [Chlorobia bacterium]|nr:SOS response-associated peptidase family protein [Fimbriimonadaceae bacterium]